MVRLCDLGELFVCGLCKGYLINAVSLMDCQHAFCRSCILKHIKSNYCCPSCGQLIHKTRPYLNIKPDPVLQRLVYRIVPGLYKNEVKRRQEFYSNHANIETFELSKEELGLVEDIEEFSTTREYPFHKSTKTQNPFYIVLKGLSIANDEIIEQESLYIICPPALPFRLLKKFLRNRLDLQSGCSFDFLVASSFIREDLLLEELFGDVDINITHSLTYALWDSCLYQREQIRSIFKHYIPKFNSRQNHSSPTQHHNDSLSSQDSKSVFGSPTNPSNTPNNCLSRMQKKSALLNLTRIRKIKLRLRRIRGSPDVYENGKVISPKIFRKCGENKYSRFVKKTSDLDPLESAAKFRSYSAERKSELRFCFRSNNLESQKGSDIKAAEDEESCGVLRTDGEKKDPKINDIETSTLSSIMNNKDLQFEGRNSDKYMGKNAGTLDAINCNKRKIEEMDTSLDIQEEVTNVNISNKNRMEFNLCKKFCQSTDNDSGIYMSPQNLEKYKDTILPGNKEGCILSQFSEIYSLDHVDIISGLRFNDSLKNNAKNQSSLTGTLHNPSRKNNCSQLCDINFINDLEITSSSSSNNSYFSNNVLKEFTNIDNCNSEIIKKNSPKVLERKLWRPHFENLTPPGPATKKKKVPTATLRG